MSYVTFDYRCPHCGLTEERFVKRIDVDAQICTHPGRLPSWHFPAIMERQLAAPSTTFRFADSKLKE